MNELLKALVTVYAKEAIRHPALRAVTLAQWLLESGRGTSRLAQLHYNFGGLKWRSEMTGFATPVLYEAHDGADKYCKFATIESFANGYWRFLDRSPYTGWEETADDAEAFIRFIGRTYSGSANYANKVLALLPEAAALLDEAGRAPAPIESEGPSLGTVVIDPGHGGTTKVGGSSPNNAIAFSGVKEKKLTLDLALMIVQQLRSQAAAQGRSVDVRMTRDSDVNVGIAERAGLARQANADLFLSLHFNGANGLARGTETFFAAAANGNVNTEADVAFARRIQSAALRGLAAGGLATRDRRVKPDTDTKAGVVGVLRDTALGNVGDPKPCRACLLELEFIDHPEVDRAIVSGAQALQTRGAVAEQLAAALIEELAAPA